MKRIFSAALVFVFLIAGLPSSAQRATTAGSPAPENSQTQDAVYRRIEGCLSNNGVSYVVAVVSDGPKQYRVTGGDTAALRDKLGHTVEIDGLTNQNSPQQMILNWDMRQATTGVGWYTIQAERVRDVTSNCSYPGFERPLSNVGPE